MEAAEYVRMAEVQDRHWWFEAKRHTVAALLARHRVGEGGGEPRRVPPAVFAAVFSRWAPERAP